MSDNPATTSDPLPPHVQLVHMGTAHWVSHILYVAAKLSLADHLAKGPARADELAVTTNTHAPSLSRFLRTLAHLGLVTEDGAGRFALTRLGEALKTGATGAARAASRTRRAGVGVSAGHFAGVSVKSVAWGGDMNRTRYTDRTPRSMLRAVYG